MPTLTITRSTPIQRTPRVVQLEGLFDVPPVERSELTWQVNRDRCNERRVGGSPAQPS